MAFDRETGLPVTAASLRTYADALAQYHISPESKFLNADYLDHGTTLRRHVRMATVQHIGKEALDWERQAVLGLTLDSEISYGVTASNLAEKLRSMVAQFGEAQVAKFLTISKGALAALMAGSRLPRHVRLARTVAARLPAAVKLCITLHGQRCDELAPLREAIELDGLRATARQLGVDASNLRRRLKLGRIEHSAARRIT